MSIIPKFRLPLTTGTDLDFEGGDITSDAGILLASESCVSIGLPEALRERLESHPPGEYDDWRVAYQRVLMLVAGYLRDADAGRLCDDPAFAHVLGGVASQPTVSRRLSAMGEPDAELPGLAIDAARSNVAKVAPRRDQIVVDVDSTLAPTFGRRQEGSALDYHYQANGCHPPVATDTPGRECLDSRPGGGTDYCSKGSGPFPGSVLDAAASREPHARIAMRGDSGFAAPEACEACEERGVTYAVRPRPDGTLRSKALEPVTDRFVPGVARTAASDFTCRAGSRDRERRVVFEAAQEEGQLFPMPAFVVTDSDAISSLLMDFHCDRGETGQIIGEAREFARGCVCSSAMAANDFRFLLATLAHGVLSWTGMPCLGEGHAKDEPRTPVWEFVRVGARRVSHGRRTCFHVSSAYPRRERFFRAVVACDRVARALRAA